MNKTLGDFIDIVDIYIAIYIFMVGPNDKRGAKVVQNSHSLIHTPYSALEIREERRRS